jgi:hypothetical protein
MPCLKQGRLCNMKPPGLVEACRLKHDALNGHACQHAINLNDVQVLAATQRCFWNPASKAFRGQQFSSELTALALHDHASAPPAPLPPLPPLPPPPPPTSASGSQTSSRSGPGTTRSPPRCTRTMKARTQLPLASPGPAPSTGSSGTTTMTAATRHSSPPGSVTTHASRTSPLPPVRPPHRPPANRLRGLLAVRFLGDCLAYVAAAELCHCDAYLNISIADVLQPAWRPVAYVPVDHAECACSTGPPTAARPGPTARYRSLASVF